MDSRYLIDYKFYNYEFRNFFNDKICKYKDFLALKIMWIQESGMVRKFHFSRGPNWHF